MSDLIIGASYRLRMGEVRAWARSARETGFDGRIVLLDYAVQRNDELASLVAYDVERVHVPLARDLLNGRAVCQIRFRDYASEWLQDRLFERQSEPRHIIATDVRDVVFQSNPSDWLTEWRPLLLGPSEAIEHQREPWNTHIVQLIYPWAWERMKNRTVLNAGTFAVHGWRRFAQLSVQVYAMCAKRPIGADQVAFNLALRLTPAGVDLHETRQSEGWAAQMAVWANPDLAPHMRDVPPKIDMDARVRIGNREPVIVHQYDRFPELKAEIERRYS